MSWKKLMSCAMLLVLSVYGQSTAEIPEGWFPFTVDARKVSTENLASVEFLNQGKATERIKVKDGHFVTSSGERVRFFGTNLCFAAALPERELAVKIAKRMKQLGFNVVRFHHLDLTHILNKEKNGLDPVQLDKLHWMMFQLRENGIYSNLNLHVSRIYKALGPLKQDFKYGKGIDRVIPVLIESQKKYAKDYLTWVNPYTGLAPVNDPMVAFVEINNENSIAELLPDRHLEAIRNHEFGREVEMQWRAWLSKKYRSFSELKRSWEEGTQPYSPVNLLASLTSIPEGEKQGSFEVTKTGDTSYDCKLLSNGALAWSYQLHFPSITYKEGQHYTVKFQARSSEPRELSVNMGLHEPPWKQYCSRKVKLDKDWKDYTISAKTANLVPDKKTRFSLNLGGYGIEKPIDVQIRNIEVHEGDAPISFKANQKISEIELPNALSPLGCLSDFREFLIDTEYAYTKEMTRYLKEDLGVKALIIDTQADYTRGFGLVREGQLSDYIDMHAYWQHPSFDPGHSWSPVYWHIPNTAMSSSLSHGTFKNLVSYRLADKPYSVSEYNHPAPNEHDSEMFPMIGSFSAFQDWDAIYQFAYGTPDTDEKPAHHTAFFSMYAHPVQMVMAPMAALMFRGNLVHPATQTTTVEIPLPLLKQQLKSKLPNSMDLPGSPMNLFGNTKFQIRLMDDGDAVTVRNGDVLTDFPILSPEISWTIEDKKHGVYSVNAPAVRAATGYIGNREFTLGDFSFELPLSGEDTASIAVAAMDGKELKESRKLLLVVAGKVSNSGMEWDEKRTTVRNKWGKAPSISPFMPFTVSLPGTVKPTVQALDGEGCAVGTINVTGAPGKWLVKASKQTPSLWFVITR